MNTLRTLKLGEWITIDGDDHQIVALDGAAVRLRDATGRSSVALAADVIRHGRRSAAPERGSDGQGPSAEPQDVELDLDRLATIEKLPVDELTRVRELEAHLLEVMTGYRTLNPPEAQPPNPRYAPGLDVEVRIKNKQEDLSVTPLKCTDRTLWRYYTAYRDFGIWGLVDKRKLRISDPLAGLDPRVRDAILEQAQVEVADSSAGLSRFYARVARRLEVQYGTGPDAPRLPADRTFRRKVNAMLGKRHPSKPADHRRNLDGQPTGLHGHLYASRPGQAVMLDSTRLDVLAYDPITDQALPLELTIAVDLFTRSIVAWRLTPLGANAMDAVSLLADMLTPEPMRPGWAERLRFAYYGPSVARAYSLDERIEAAAARPLIWPETLIVDNGKIFVSDPMREACERYGITLQFARLRKATDKPQVERAFETIRTQFAEHVAGYKGRNVSHRGPDVEGTARWSLDEIEEFFAEYIVAVYQRRPHSGLYAPGAPEIAMSPNDMYAEGIAVAGAIPVPAEGLYHDLLKVEWRKIHRYGVEIDRLVYDGAAFNGLRETDSPYPGGLWPIRVDPRNRLQVFFKRPDDGEWHALRWIRAENWLQPFTDRSIDYVVGELRARGRTHPLEQEVAAALHDLQRRMDAPEAATAKDKRRLTRDRARAKSVLRDQARAGYEPPDKIDTLSVAEDAVEGDGVTELDVSSLTGFRVYGADEGRPRAVDEDEGPEQP